MAATQDYAHSYSFDVNANGTYTISTADRGSYSQVGDEGGDGSLSVNEYLTFQAGNSLAHIFSYRGETDGVGGIFCYNGANTAHGRLFTDTPRSLGEVLHPIAQAVHVFCFARGTLIRTVNGERAVETLNIGDTLLNASGAAVAVKWIGHQRRNALFAALNHQLPIRICAGALGDGLPTRDLYVSPDHAMLVEGCLVHASALLNDRTITQMQSWDGDVEYFHIETDAHELIVAEGAATETFIDNVARETFDNHAEYAALYPNAAPMQELELPRICHARQLPRAISRKLDAVADQLLGKAALAA